MPCRRRRTTQADSQKPDSSDKRGNATTCRTDRMADSQVFPAADSQVDKTGDFQDFREEDFQAVQEADFRA